MEQNYKVTQGDPRETGPFLKTLGARGKRVELFSV